VSRTVYRVDHVFLQIKTKISQTQQSLAKPGPRISREKALISFDSLDRNEPFQRVAPTPQRFFFCPASADKGPEGMCRTGTATA
jgi:hypothetical protein